VASKYAPQQEDQPIPFDIIEENIRDASFQCASASRNVIGVVFREGVVRGLEEEVTAEAVLKLADKIEHNTSRRPQAHVLY
jgi:hypothetical protein